MAELRKQLDSAGLAGKVRLLLITYDPEFDTSEVLKAYAEQHRLSTNGVTLLRLDKPDANRLFADFKVAVNYNSAGVNIHGIQLLLFDKHGRWVRTYHTLIWDNDSVLGDLKRILAEN